MRDRSSLGKMSRDKGIKFELTVRDLIKQALPEFPDLTVRRSLQAERPWDADLIIEGDSSAPRWLVDLWVECQHADNPRPAAKLAQATRDATLSASRTGRARHPVVAWRQTRAREVHASTDLRTFMTMMGAAPPPAESWSGCLVTVPLKNFLVAVHRARSGR